MSEGIDFSPTGPARPGSIYLSYKLSKALGMVARASDTNREAIAEVVLSEWLAGNHPDVMAWLNKRDDDEKQFQKSIQPSRVTPETT